MPVWLLLFWVTFANSMLTLGLAFYLDFRRMNLAAAGILPRKTPEILGIGSINLGYVFSHEIEKSLDVATRRWTPWLRFGVCLSGGLFLATGLSMLFA